MDIYSARRAALACQLGPKGVAIVPTAPEQQRNRDSSFPYRHDSYFYYLCGFTEPHAWLVIQGDGHTTLFCQPKDLEREIWDGYRLGPDAALQALGVQKAYPVDTLDSQILGLLDGSDAVWYPFGTHNKLESQVSAWLAALGQRTRWGALVPGTQKDLCSVLDEMRLLKDAHELDILRRASEISAQAHVRAMKMSANMLRSGADLREYHLDAELLHTFRQHGSQYPAYGNIVASGANACVLHYQADVGRIRDGDMVLIDAGCELDGYASDITRTFPANGRFTAPQRDLYDIVLAALEAARAVTRPGARFTDGHDAAVRVLTQGMLDLGLLNKAQYPSLDSAIEQQAYTPFYMHRTGHWMGMDVHDCGSYNEPSELANTTLYTHPVTHQTSVKRPSRRLQPGMVLTIEPGIYVRPAPDVPQAFHNIGIRIEDDAVVTPDGCELITRQVPVSRAEIEALMAC
jgi:Xaa-Pro aminopeptidase